MSFEDDLKAEYEAERPTRDVSVSLNKKPYVLRFTRMDGTEWASLGDRAPARPGVLLDMRYGYNLRALVLIAAPLSGKRLDGDTPVDLTPDQWKNLLRSLPGSSIGRIGDALFDLNEYGPAEEVEQAKKASAAESTQTSD